MFNALLSLAFNHLKLRTIISVTLYLEQQLDLCAEVYDRDAVILVAYETMEITAD